MKEYQGYRLLPGGKMASGERGKCGFKVLVPGHAEYPLPARNDIRDHSPGGFEWGYGGSGPAQLALALVADCRGEPWARPAVYQRLKRIVAALPFDGWKITQRQLDAWIDEIALAIGFAPSKEADE